MQNSKNKKVLQIVLLVVIAVVTLGIGYASITAINLIINGNATASVNQNNFIVHFIEAKNITGTTGVGGTSVIETDDTKASFNVTGLTKVGDYAEAKYVVKNDSNGIGAEITLELTNSNNEYFRVTETIDDNKLQAGDTTLATVKVEMTKTPIDSDVSTSVTAKLVANPIENAEATGGESKEEIRPGTFAGDSWSTIKTNVQNGNTDQYNIGDTKTVTINNKNYIVRLANKTTSENCSNENYSETACGFVVEFAEIIDKMMMRNSHTNDGGYPNTLIYAYLRDTLYEQLPTDLQDAIKTTRVISGHGNNGIDNANFKTIDKLYLLSGIEVFGIADYDTAVGTTHQLEYYQGMERIEYTDPYFYTVFPLTYKGYNGSDGSDEIWWLRTHRSNGSTSFLSVGFGNFRSDMANGASCQGGAGVSPAFRIG